MSLTTEIIQEGLVFLVDKPLKWTSFDVVNKLRYAIRHQFDLRKIKVGHAGTLDPLASGLLIVCCGKLTKRIELFMAEEKEYTGTLQLGAVTPSYDTETEPEQFHLTDHISSDLIRQKMLDFTGEIRQYPPIFSAVKQEGKKLYEHARAGTEVEIKSRTVIVPVFELLDKKDANVSFRVVCSKGTYIRSLAHDLGQALGCGAYLSSLRRVRSGNFTIDQAFSVEKLVDIIKNSHS